MYTFIVSTWLVAESGSVERAKLLLGLLLLGQVLDDLLLLGLETLLSALAGLLCLGTTSLGLITAGQTERRACSYPDILCVIITITPTSAAAVPGEVQSWVGAVLSLAYLPLIGLSQTFSACLYFSLPPTITSLLCLSLAMPTLINPFKNKWLQSRTSPLSSQKLKSKKKGINGSMKWKKHPLKRVYETLELIILIYFKSCLSI